MPGGGGWACGCLGWQQRSLNTTGNSGNIAGAWFVTYRRESRSNSKQIATRPAPGAVRCELSANGTPPPTKRFARKQPKFFFGTSDAVVLYTLRNMVAVEWWTFGTGWRTSEYRKLKHVLFMSP